MGALDTYSQSMRSNLLERSVSDVLSAALDAASSELLVVDPGPETIEALVESLDDDSTVRLLCDMQVLKDVLGDFIVASRAADHVEDGRLEIYTTEGSSNTVFLTEDAVVAVVRGDDCVAGLTTKDEEFVESVHIRLERKLEYTDSFTLRTPSRERVLKTLESTLGSEAASDFEAVLSSLDSARGGDELDEVTISLLVAARNEALLYDVSKWGEDVRIASKATFSRTKTQLEEAGIIDTEKVPIDVGRPRLRLKLPANSTLRDADPVDLAAVAESKLES